MRALSICMRTTDAATIAQGMEEAILTQKRTEEGRGAFTARCMAHADTILCAVIALCMFALLLLYAGKKSFFSDEMDQLGILVRCGSLREVFALYATMAHEVAPPLFAMAAFVWSRLMPLSQRWLQALPALAACIGIFFTGRSGRLLGGKRTAVLASLLACAAPAMATTIGTQFRQYGFVFLFASLSVYAWLRRLHHPGKPRVGDIVLYGVAMAGLPYSHYLSVFVCFFLFLVDAVLFFQKKIRFSCIWSYVIGAALFAPWAITILGTVMGIGSFWVPVPRMTDMRDALYFLTDTISIRFFLYIGGLCTATVALFCGRDGLEKRDGLVNFALAVAAPVMIALVFVYSKWLGDGVSLFLPRYFLCTLPMVILTCAQFANRLYARLLAVRAAETAAGAAAFLLIFGVLSGAAAWQNIETHTAEIYEPYREAADWLSARPDIYDASTAVVTAGESQYVTAGWETLYITQNGRRPDFVIFDRVRPFTQEDADSFDTVYVMQIHAALAPVSEETLGALYARDEESADDGAKWNVRRYTRLGS